MTEVVAVDVGGTHARFALAEVAAGRVTRLGDPVTLRTADHPGFEQAWAAFAAALGRPLPRAAGIAIAAPPHGDAIKLTNNDWTLRPATFAHALGLDRFVLVNDFGAVGHAVAQLGADAFRPLCGPDCPVADARVVTVVGPGTGLGVAQLVRRGGGAWVIETEGGHVDFAPLDAVEDAILAHLRPRHGRVSIERLASGPGLVAIHVALAAIEGRSVAPVDDKALWTAALAGKDATAAAALDRFCRILGAVAGDLALAQGSEAVVIAGGLGLRLADHLPRSGFAARFVAKGRFAARMAAMPVSLITYAQPGLYGAAAALAQALEE